MNTIKFGDAKQAKDIPQYRNIKDKMYKTSATIWFNCTNFKTSKNFNTILTYFIYL
jgi:hypothetical protein